ncbi:MAG TPA: hypothetical protein VMD09_10705 [Solirubrobacteraceae bacterium]|nr:hypothetical protein [Solirubrobacteraceae bacterium]
MTSSPPEIGAVLASTVFIDGANRPFGELSLDEVRARADELRAATGWGPMARVAPVARAWRELSLEMERADAVRVAELDHARLAALAPQLWVVLPG